MSGNIWWLWVILAALFFVGEIFTTAFFLLWFGVGAVAAGILALLGVGFGLQVAVFVVVSFVLVVLSRRFAERFTKAQPPGIGADRVVGQSCVVLEEVNNSRNTGRVRMDREEWRAESDSGEVIASGTPVVVTRITGTHLVVKPVGKGG